ncbi:hypothetical protein L249_7181 [Ophiocordyceps polyrhachis-furcata BCC 54312]|uniref:Uncharacterized protein n=1 Tax=Ophiocordyceps polyrhachis-furcata BCC 54312 TaxID=1330021 RepID=A0A367L9J8_9HYPO|nr:hypothetical protein L249_7181 [Ophiocordyceps polyrhachis-furcata BCC 54312]
MPGVSPRSSGLTSPQKHQLLPAKHNMENSLEQPDFPLAVSSLVTLTKQVSLCQNLPSVNEGRRLADVLDGLQRSVEGLRTDVEGLRTEVQGLRTEVQGLRTEVQGLRTEVQGLRTEVQVLRTEVRTMGGKLDQLDRKTTVINKNFTARIENSHVIHDEVKLVPLYSVVTGNLVPNFPKTLQDLDALTEQRVNFLLTQLGEEARGRPDDRRDQLEMALGVRARASKTSRRH